MSSAQQSKPETAEAIESSDARYDDPDLPPVLSQRRPRTGTTKRNEDNAPDTIPAPMWFVEE